jgi:hypothetical protein
MKTSNIVILSQNEFGIEPNITKLYLSTNDMCFVESGYSFEEYVKEQVDNVLEMYNHSIVLSEETFDNLYEIECEETEVEY